MNRNKSLKHLKKQFKSLGLSLVQSATQVSEAGRSFHIGASFPMKTNPGRLQSDLMGRVTGLKRIHLVDSSNLPSIPANTITLTVMANAHRIAKEYKHYAN